MSETQKVFELYRTAGFADSELSATEEGYGVAFARWLPAERDASILDVGCGGGEFLHYLHARGYAQLHGFDLSPEQVRRCHERGFPQVTLVPDAVGFLENHRHTYACVVMNDVLEHVPKRTTIALLEAIRGALIPDGRLLVKVPNAANLFGLVARYLDFTHEVAFTETSLRQVLLTAGFRQIEICGQALPFQLRPQRLAYWTMNTAYKLLHRGAYLAAVGVDAPKILDKLLLARAEV